MVNFDGTSVLLGFAGGVIIAMATSLNLLLKGRITGISGIFFGLISYDANFIWKSSFISAFLIISTIFYQTTNYRFYDPPDLFGSRINLAIMGISGLLVGFGTKLGNGCTSGHGVCGLPRFSKRSFVAVGCFMGMAMLVASLNSFDNTNNQEFTPNPTTLQLDFIPIGIAILLLGHNLIRNDKGKQGLVDILISFGIGAIFMTGLLISGMTQRSKVINFLTIGSNWDPTLMFVMGGAVLFNLISFHYIIQKKKTPLLCKEMELPKSKTIDKKLVLGASIFGVGWGLSGMCPGPAIGIIPVFLVSMVMSYLPGLIVGQYLAKYSENFIQKITRVRQEPKILTQFQ